jgi:hypothetical protein
MQPAPYPAAAPILVADTDEAVALVRDSLRGVMGVRHAATLEAAKRLLSEATPLVVCGCHFDEGRMYDLLRYMKSRPILAATPFLAIRVVKGQLDDALYESVKIATQALGGHGFVDLFRWQLRYGEAEASQRLSRTLEELARQGRPASS